MGDFRASSRRWDGVERAAAAQDSIAAQAQPVFVSSLVSRSIRGSQGIQGIRGIRGGRGGRGVPRGALSVPSVASARLARSAQLASSVGNIDRSQSREHLRTVCVTLAQQLLLAQDRQSGHGSPMNHVEPDPILGYSSPMNDTEPGPTFDHGSPKDNIRSDPTLPTIMAPSATPTIDNFLSEIHHVLRNKDGAQLKNYLVIEPPLPQEYTHMVSELRRSFPAEKEDALETKCTNLLPETDKDGEIGGSWSGFLRFLKLYFGFLRDVNVENLLETQEMLAELVR